MSERILNSWGGKKVISLLYKKDRKYCIITYKCSISESKCLGVSILVENSVSANKGRCDQNMCD